MFKTKIKFKYAVVLAEKLNKKLKIDCSAIDTGKHIGLVTIKELTRQDEKQIKNFINTFEFGVAVVEAELLFK